MALEEARPARWTQQQQQQQQQRPLDWSGGVWRFVRHSTAKAIDLFERQSKRTKRGRRRVVHYAIGCGWSPSFGKHLMWRVDRLFFCKKKTVPSFRRHGLEGTKKKCRFMAKKKGGRKGSSSSNNNNNNKGRGPTAASDWCAGGDVVKTSPKDPPRTTLNPVNHRWVGCRVSPCF